MSIVAAELIAEITVKGAEAAIGQIEGLGGVVGSVGGVLATFGVAAAGALIGVGAESVKMAGDFQQSLTQLVTGAGESQKNLQMVSDGILNLAVATGTTTGQITEAMYMIESAGYRGASALDVLKASAEGAKAGNADLGTTAKAVTIVMHDYASSHITATQAANALIATEQNGQAHLQELAKSMGAVLPIASAAGVSFQDVAGAIALMTTGGMTAQHASQNLANAIRSLEAPSSVAQKAMQSVGLSAQDLKDTLSTKGLDGAIQLISDDVGKKFPAGSVQSVEAFKAIMGGVAGYNVALQLGGAHMKAYQDDIKKIGDALHKGGSDVEGFALVQQNFNFKLDQAKEALNVLMIRLGTALLPVLGQVLTALTPLILAFSSWVSSSQTANQAMSLFHVTLSVLGPILQAIGGFLVSTFAPVLAQLRSSWTQLQAAIAPIMPQLQVLAGAILITLVASLAGLIVMLARVIQGFVQFATGVVQVFSGIVQFTQGFVNLMHDILTGNFGKIGADLSTMMNGIKTMFQGVLNIIHGLFTSTFGAIEGFTQGFSDTITRIFAGLSNTLVGHSIIPDMINAIVATFASLPGRVLGIVVGMVASVIGSFANMAARAIGSVQAMAASVTASFSSFAGQVLSTISNMAYSVAGTFASLPGRVMGSVQGLVNSVVATFATLPGRVVGAVAGLGGMLAGVFNGIASSASAWGANIVNGFVNGIRSQIGAAGQAAADVVQNAAGALGVHDVPLPGFASGTSFAPGGLAVVGERGPEVMYVPRGAQITPVSNPQLRAATQSQPTIIVQPPSIYLDGRLLANGLMPHITSAIRYGTGVR